MNKLGQCTTINEGNCVARKEQQFDYNFETVLIWLLKYHALLHNTQIILA